jgi:hypothetical protein
VMLTTPLGLCFEQAHIAAIVMPTGGEDHLELCMSAPVRLGHGDWGLGTLGLGAWGLGGSEANTTPVVPHGAIRLPKPEGLLTGWNTSVAALGMKDKRELAEYAGARAMSIDDRRRGFSGVENPCTTRRWRVDCGVGAEVLQLISIHSHSRHEMSPFPETRVESGVDCSTDTYVAKTGAAECTARARSP